MLSNQLMQPTKIWMICYFKIWSLLCNFLFIQISLHKVKKQNPQKIPRLFSAQNLKKILVCE